MPRSKGVSLKMQKIEPKGKWQHPKPQHSVLPRHPFSLFVVAPPASGKTNMICNLLINQYKGYFHKAVICSPTISNDAKWEVIKAEKGILKENKKLEEIMGLSIKKDGKSLPPIIHKSVGDETETMKAKKREFDGKIPEEAFSHYMDGLQPWLDKQSETLAALKEKGYGDQALYLMDRLFVILDDQAGQFSQSRQNPITEYFIRFRHYNTSVIVVTQANKEIPKTIRTCCQAAIIFEIGNHKELETIQEEWQCNMTQPAWYAAYKLATEEQYNFLYLNRTFPRGKRAYKNFEHMIKVNDAKPKDAEKPKKEQQTVCDADASDGGSDSADEAVHQPEARKRKRK